MGMQMQRILFRIILARSPYLFNSEGLHMDVTAMLTLLAMVLRACDA